MTAPVEETHQSATNDGSLEALFVALDEIREEIDFAWQANDTAGVRSSYQRLRIILTLLDRIR